MQLSFLGQSYTAAAPTLEATETQDIAMFLGKPYAKKAFHGVQRQQPSEALTFMGRRYTR